METFIATSIVTFTLTCGFSSFIRTTTATNVWGTRRRRVFGPKHQKLHPKLHINLPTSDYFLSPPSSFYRSNVMATMHVLPASHKREKKKKKQRCVLWTSACVQESDAPPSGVEVNARRQTAVSASQPQTIQSRQRANLCTVGRKSGRTQREVHRENISEQLDPL